MSTEIRVPFTGRAHNYTDAEVQTVVEAMKTAVPLTQGKYMAAFQEKMAAHLNSPHCFAVSTATSGLELAAQLCQFNEGDEVIIPGHTFTASAYPFAKKGAKIVWADIDAETRVVTADTIAACLSSKTKAIVVVHLYGYVCDMGPIMELAKANNLIVVEDVAQAFSGELNGQQAGTFGDIGIFSFHSHKNVSTLGEGGMIVTPRDDFAAVIPMLRHNGHCAFDFPREQYWKPAMGNVDLPELNGEPLMPNNYCLGEVECALGAKLIDRIDAINADKRDRALRFIDAIGEDTPLKFHRVDSTRHTYHLLAAEFQNDQRDAFIEHMYSQKGVQTIVQYYPLYRYDFYKKLGMGEANCPNTDRFFDNMISFPFHHCLSDEDFGYMLSATKSVIQELCTSYTS